MNILELRNYIISINELKKLEEEMHNLVTSHIMEMNEFRNLENKLDKINFWDKLFKTSKYSEYKDKLSKNKEIERKKDILKETYKTRKKNLEERITSLNETINNPNYFKHEEQTNFYNKSKNINLNSNGFLEINDSNKEITIDYLNKDISKDFDFNNMMLVHATEYFPENYLIKTLHDKKVPTPNPNTIHSRNTIHFSLNGKVSANSGGNWNNTPIIIMEPIRTHIEQLACIKENDTYTYGSVKLSDNAIILISKEKFEKIYNENKEEINKRKEHFIIFDGNSEVAVNNILILLGHKPQTCSYYSWSNEKNSEFFDNYIKNNYPNKNLGHHYGTKHRFIDEFFVKRNTILNSLRNESNTYLNDDIISLEELYILFNEYLRSPIDPNKFNEATDINIKNFIKFFGINCHDNEIHLLSHKEALENYEKEISDNQLNKVKLLLKKYEISKQLENRHESKSK